MRNKLLLICLILPTTAFAQVSPENAASATQARQPLLSRLRGDSAEPASTRQQLQQQPVQVAQPANTGGYQPGVTYPQQQRQQQPQQAQPQQSRPQYQQPAYPAYPPQQMQPMPYNVQQPGARPTPTPTPRAVQSTSDSSRETPRSTRTSSRNSNSNDDSQQSSSKKSTGSSSSSNSSRSNSRSAKSSDDDEKKSTSSSDDTGDSKTSTKSSQSSALEKIAKNVESGKSSEKEDSEDEPEEAAEVEKTEEEIAAEKARAAGLKSADEATTVVATFLKQANDSNYSKATESLAPAIQKYFESEISAVNGTKKAVLDELTAKGTITMVTYLNTTVRGEGAVVETELGYDDGRTARRSFDMIKIDGDWKILLAVNDGVSSAKSSSNASTPAAQSSMNGAPAATPAAAPPTAEQAASRGPLVLVPPTTNPGSLSTTSPAP